MKTQEERRAYQKAWKAANKDRVKRLAREYAKRARLRDPEKIKAQLARWKERNPEKTERCRKKHELKRLYGLSYEAYVEMKAAQGGACAICGAADLNVDHCHATNVVRGLLCQPCNFAIGLLKDNPVLCHKAGMYLLKHQQVGEVA